MIDVPKTRLFAAKAKEAMDLVVEEAADPVPAIGRSYRPRLIRLNPWKKPER